MFAIIDIASQTIIGSCDKEFDVGDNCFLIETNIDDHQLLMLSTFDGERIIAAEFVPEK